MRVFRVDPMASRVWQACVRRLTTQSENSHHNVANIMNEWSFFSSGRTFLRSYGELGGRTRAASGGLWIQSRFYNVGVGAGSSCARTLSGEELASVKNFGRRILSPFSRWNSAMHNSNISSDEQDAGQNAPSDDVSSKLDVEKSEDQEFVPENVDTPTTPLVQAIRDSQDDEVPGSVSHKPKETFGEIPPSNREIDPLRVFVGGLPFSVRGDELKEALHQRFGEHGVVQDVQLSQHRDQSKTSIDAGKHRGFAFVTMSTPEESRAVIEKLNGESMWGRNITVSFGLKKIEPDPSAPQRRANSAVRLARCKVFVGNLHEDTSLETLENRFKQFGTVTSAKLIYELASKKSRGFGFITFEDEAQAMKAILDLDGSILDGSVIRVNIAKYPQSV